MKHFGDDHDARFFRCDGCGRVFVQQGGLTLAVPAIQPARRPEPDLESGG